MTAIVRAVRGVLPPSVSGNETLRLLRTRVTFERASLLLLLILWIPLCAILICNQLITGLNLAFLAPIGFGPGKQKIFTSLSVSFLICSVLLYVSDLRRERLWTRSLLLVVLAVTYVGSVDVASAVEKYLARLAGSDPSFYDFGKIKFEEYPNLDYARVFSKKTLRSVQLSSFADLSRFAERRFSEYRPALESAWGVENELFLRPFFYLNFVASLWGYGNRAAPQETGCVLINEDTKFEPIPEPQISVRTYVESDIGCCTDYAYMLHFLLGQAHFESRLVELPGHVLNEVKVNGRWMALDANINVFYRQSWKETVSRSGNEIGVVMFPLLSLNPNARQDYRPLAGSFRQFMLARVTMGFHVPVHYSQSLPDYFR
jgi:hypothetical protein